MKKRLTAVLLVAAMTVLALAGCAKKEKPLPDTIRFFNASYAIITTRNGADVNLVGGYDKEDNISSTQIQSGLESAWGVTNTQEAKETMEWLTTEGHNKEVLAGYEDNALSLFTREELVELMVEPDFTEAEAIMYLSMYDAVSKYGDNAILAWDLSRALQLLGWYYIAGYYTYEESMDASLDVAKRLQESFSSWDEMTESYFLGYRYWSDWSGANMESNTAEYDDRIRFYDELKAQEDGPFSVDWNTQLQKEW